MTTQATPEIILYDLACNKNVCFSPVVWRIRLMLNYKCIPYKTVFLEFPDIEPKLKELHPFPYLKNVVQGLERMLSDHDNPRGLVPSAPTPESRLKYTVPSIHHLPSDTCLMDSLIIAKFLEIKYPIPPIPLTSDLGHEIETKARQALGAAFRTSIMPREIKIVSPRAQEYFRRTREAWIGHRLEDLLDGDKEEQSWKAVDGSMRELGKLLQTHKADGPFVLGDQPSYVDFFITGSLQCARVVDEGVFERIVSDPGFKRVYEACVPFMNKKD